MSYERVLSGTRARERLPVSARVPKRSRSPRGSPTASAPGDPAPVITEAALAREDPICDEALTRFVSIYGAAAGNFALTALAVGGVFVGGGIAPKILPRIVDGPFLTSFACKGRFRMRCAGFRSTWSWRPMSPCWAPQPA